MAHGATRMAVERCIGLYKGRFRKLKTLTDIDKLEDIPEIVICACVLHNIFIAELDIEGFLEDGEGDDDDDDANDISPPGTGGSDKRNIIMRLLHQDVFNRSNKLQLENIILSLFNVCKANCL